MFYRMRIYETVRENLPLFHEFFRSHLLPVQLRHGARLIGRWETEDGRVVAVWEYDDRAAYERIAAAVRSDPDSRKAQELRAQLPPIITSGEETFMTPTVAAASGQPISSQMPKVVGVRVHIAEAAIKLAISNPDIVIERSGTRSPPESVSAQHPLPGAVLTPGAQVTLTVSVWP
jgi:hypothetical protein